MKNSIVILFLTVTLIFPACININLPPGSTPPATPGSNQPPLAYIDSISPPVVEAGNPVAFSGHGSDVDGTIAGYEWRSSLEGIISTVPVFNTSALSLGQHTIIFRVLDNEGQWSPEASATLNIGVSVAKPLIEYFSLSQSSIVRNGSTELSWRVNNASSVLIDNGIGQVEPTGSRVVLPLSSTVYKLTASNAGGSVSAEVSVQVVASATIGNPIVSFSAQHLGGNSWQINWNVQYATRITIEPEIGEVGPVGSAIITVPSGQTKTYRCYAENDWGWAYHDVQMTMP